ncbi:MAG: hypothetical protein WC749_13155 [Dehalococcoidia bacterium]
METQQNKTQNRSRDLSYFHGEAVTTSVESASVAYQAPSLVAAGMNAQGVPLVSSLSNGLMALLCIKIPSLVGRTSGIKTTALFISIANVLTWIPVVFVFFFMRPIDQFGLATLWLLNLVPSILIAPIRDSWLVDTVPHSKMRRYFGLRSAISAGVYLVIFCALGFVLEISGGQPLTGFAIVYIVATLAALSSLLFYFRIHSQINAATQEKPKHDQEKPKSGLVDFIKETRRGYLGTVILYSSLFNFSMCIATPLLAVYVLEDLHLGYMIFMALICCEFSAKAVGSMFWRRYTGTNGNLGIICKVSPFLCLVPLLWLVSSNLIYLAAIQALTGFMWAGFELGYNVLIYEAAPQDKRLNYICYSRTLNMVSMSLGALAAAGLVLVMFPIFGSKILGLFLISGILRFTVLKLMLPQLKKQQQAASPSNARERKSSALDTRPPVPAPTPVLAQSSSRKPWDWTDKFVWESSTPKLRAAQDSFSKSYLLARFSKDTSVPQEDIMTEKEIAVLSLKQGLLFRPNDWHKFNGKPIVSKQELPQTEILDVLSLKHGLFFRPHEWHKFNGEPSAPKQELPRTEMVEAVSSKHGLLFRPNDWHKFNDKPAVSKLEMPQAEVVGAIPTKQGLLYRPHDWHKFDKLSPAYA